MTDLDAARRDALFALLPAIHRQRDDERAGLSPPPPGTEATGPLRALLGVLATEGGRVEDDIRALLDDWFIETCADWVVPYIGDLLGVRGLRDIATPGFSRRALVANTLSYRRGKGVARVIEQLAQDATGWRAVAREMFLQLGGTQHVNHLRPDARTADLHRSAVFDPPQRPFGTMAHRIDVRSVALGRGRFNIPHVAVFLWRLQAYALARAEPAPGGPSDGFVTGLAGTDAPLFNPPRSDAGTADRSDLRSVPGPLRRRALHDELEARRQALAEGRPLPRLWFDERPEALSPAVLTLELDGVAVPPERLEVCDLASWRQPADSRDYTVAQPDGSTVTVPLPIEAAIDPQLGRLRLAPARAGASVRLTHAYGFPGDIGAGPYNRRAALEPLLAERPVTFAAGVAREAQSPSAGTHLTLADALAAWRAEPPGSFGVIALMDSGRHGGDLTGADAITVPEGSRLLILGAGWPALPDPDGPPGSLIRQPGVIEPAAVLPRILGAVEVQGTAPAGSETPGELILDGLLLEQGLSVLDGHLGRLSLDHLTLRPGGPGVGVAAGNPDLVLTAHRSILAALDLPVPLAGLRLTDCIVDARPDAISAPQAMLEICDSTVLGTTTCLGLEASGVIFAGPVTVTRLQTGCVRYSSLGAGSITPRRFRCQPQLALEGAAPAELPAIEARLRPAFTAETFGQPGYAQLAVTCAPEILRGGEDGDEMGAWRFLHQPQRLSNLRNLLPDYLPFGLEAGLFFET
ncbi:hypothetical protein RNZ50_03270 [Paracoccaceae bacterium Fryx2]|nr:hypothetical protein [Paracoccaceae bacterium Fryx2]